MDEMKALLKQIHKLYSTWVVAIFSAAGAWWLQASPAEQAQFMADWPILVRAVPYVGFVTFVLARITPQGGDK